MSLRLIKGGPSTPPQNLGLADYVWIDNSGELQAKSRVIPVGVDAVGEPVPIIERWTAHDGEGIILLSPCHYLPDPLRPQPSFITLCEVRDVEDRPSNPRSVLRQDLGRDASVWWGFRQEYQLRRTEPDKIEPATWREHYAVAERHLGACLDAGLMVHSADLEAGTFKVGPRGMPQSVDESPTALVVADHLWIARYLLKKVAREQGLTPFFAGRRCTVFFSTERTRGRAITGIDLAESIIRLSTRLAEDGESSWTPSLRGSVVAREGGLECIEDQGPHGDADPYTIALRWLRAIRTET